jgi:CubicO group peptidase (beta-lactamase class C family)
MKRIIQPSIILIFSVLFQISCVNKSVTLGKVGLSADTLELATNKMQEYIDNGKLAGISALIYKNGDTVYREEFGYASLERSENDG